MANKHGFLSLMEGEEVQIYTHQSRILGLRHFLKGIFLALLVVVLAEVGIRYFMGDKASPSWEVWAVEILVPLMILVVEIAIGVIKPKLTTYVVTNFRVVVRRGILSKNVTEVRIADIRAVNLNKRLAQRLLGIGDIQIGSSATAGAEVVVEDIASPEKFIEAINRHRKG